MARGIAIALTGAQARTARGSRCPVSPQAGLPQPPPLLFGEAARMQPWPGDLGVGNLPSARSGAVGSCDGFPATERCPPTGARAAAGVQPRRQADFLSPGRLRPAQARTASPNASKSGRDTGSFAAFHSGCHCTASEKPGESLT